MFFHLYGFRFKTLVYKKETMFWSLLFPILLSTCFALALSAIADKAYTFHSIPVAVVFEREDAAFRTVLEESAQNDSQGEPFLLVTETDAGTAASLLEEGKVVAVVTVFDEISMTVKQEGINQTAVAGFLTEYLKNKAIVENIAETAQDPAAFEKLAQAMSESVDYLTTEQLVDSETDTMAGYYFSLIAMTALFGSFLGLSCSREMQANISAVGLRKSIAPIRRRSLILSEFLAAYIIHLAIMVCLLLYMRFVLQINFGAQFGYIAFVCALGSLFGIAFGFFVGSIARLKEAAQVAVLVAGSLLSSFFSGLMTDSIKIFLTHRLPLLNRINPATLISDALYSLQVYDSHTRYFQNIAVLAAEAVILLTVSCLMTRRKKYADL